MTETQQPDPNRDDDRNPDDVQVPNVNPEERERAEQHSGHAEGDLHREG